MTEITAEVIVGKPFLWFNKQVSITMLSEYFEYKHAASTKTE